MKALTKTKKNSVFLTVSSYNSHISFSMKASTKIKKKKESFECFRGQLTVTAVSATECYEKIDIRARADD